MPTTYVDDDPGVIQWIPGGAGPTVTEVVAGRRIVVSDAIDQFGPWTRSSAPLFADNVLLTATFNPTTGCIELVGTGLDVFTSVRIEKSLDLISWSTVRGAADLAVVAGTVSICDYEFTDGVTNYYRLTTLAPFEQTSDVAFVVPTLGDIWLKSISRPFLNMRVCVVQPPAFQIAQTARTGIFPIKGRTYPVAVNDLRLARRWTLNLRTETAADTQALTYLLASGDVLLLQVPYAAREAIPAGYITVGDTVRENHPLRPLRVTWTLPVTEVAPPGPFVVPATATWQSLINQYGSWAEVIAAFSSWADLLANLVGDPSEVIVA